ncbi:MAG: hypothetical protein M0P31_13565 [Solirubrobacteraceae bacterium]|nr:hypothetical protein [Solirubrobacteraceae bacterium]
MSTATARAACGRCPWTATTANALAIAALHHDRTGHPVHVDLHRRVTYGDSAADAPGQESLTAQLEEAA